MKCTKGCFFLICLLSLVFTCKGQSTYIPEQLRPEIREIIGQFEDTTTIHLADCDSGNSPDYALFQQLKMHASQNDLFELTKHPCANIKAYSFYILSRKEGVDIFPILLEHLNDPTCIDAIYSCYIEAGYYPCHTLSDFFIDVAVSNSNNHNTKLLSLQQLNYLDSILIYAPTSNRALRGALRRLKPLESRYDRIKELYEEKGSGQALVSLAKYNKKEDREHILNAQRHLNKRYVFEAIKYFPDDFFIPFLQDELANYSFSLYQEEPFFKAIAAYKDERANEMLNEILEILLKKDQHEYELEKLLFAVDENCHEAFTEIMYALWSHAFISPQVFNFLLQYDIDKTFDYTKKSIKDSIHLNQYLGGIYNKKTDTLLHVMMDLIIQKDILLAKEVLVKNLREAHVLMFPAFAEYAALLKDEVFIAPLIDVARNNPFDHNCRAASSALIAYQRLEINETLHEIAQERKGTPEGRAIKSTLEEFE
ncbi:MAG: hypothetical protein AAF487_07320 [Bacteroidota bacterium]